MNKADLYFKSPTYLFEKYKQMRRFGWTLPRIGMFLNSYLLFGHPRDNKNPARIHERSFQALIKYSNEVSQRQVVQDKHPDLDGGDFFTPTELIEMFPAHAKAFNWTPTKIGVFHCTKLLNGYKVGAGRSSFISRKSFVLLINHTIGTIERRVEILPGTQFPKGQ